MKIEINEIKKLLPHRYPFLFLDWCEIIEVGKEGRGFRKFLHNEFFFKGHFPGNPIVPGVILVESLAQTAGIVVSQSFSNQKPTLDLTHILNPTFVCYLTRSWFSIYLGINSA